MKSAFLLSKGLLCLYDKQNNTWLLVDMEFLFSCSTRYLSRSLHSLVSYRVKHSKRNSLSTRAHVLFSIYTIIIIQVVWHYDISGFLLNRHFKTKMIDFWIEKLTNNRHSYLIFISLTSKGHNSQFFFLVVNKLSTHLFSVFWISITGLSRILSKPNNVYLCYSKHSSGIHTM